MNKIYLKKVPAHESPNVCHDKNMNPCYWATLVDGQNRCKPIDKDLKKFKCYDPSVVFIKVPMPKNNYFKQDFTERN